MSDEDGARVIDFGPPEIVPDADDAPPRPVHECEVCQTPLIYGGRGRPPTRCDIHKRTANAGTSRPRKTATGRATRAEQEAAELAKKLDVKLSTGTMMVAALDVRDGKALLAAKPTIVTNYQSVMATHDNWRRAALDVTGTGSVAGLVLGVLLALAPIAANHGLIPERVGQLPAGELFQRLPDVMLKLQRAAESGEEVLREYMAREEAKQNAAREAAAHKQGNPVDPT